MAVDLRFVLTVERDDATSEAFPMVCTEAKAKGRALSLAKKTQSPVDVSWPAGSTEDERYIGTASPNEFWARGARWSASELRG